ncbi:metal ABC transporter substrate-binding protein [Yoonia litorea]|uniref:metal ABC transporter substrate-binding protein n=1 Tax=Yoonia litorea TaxID=1123755 RepID=UPI0013F4DBB5|nr:zinc ABC transporter substrate-binding protein [Yoonia litorea]
MRLLSTLVIAISATFAHAQDKPRVVTANYPLQYMAERLLDDAADVVFPVPEGVDPSFWRPSIEDISAIQSSDLILLNGAGFSTWVDRVSLPRAKTVNTSAGLEDQFIVTESITHSHGDGGEHSHEGLAAYLWLDPTLAIAQAESVAEAITARGLAVDIDVGTQLSALRTDLEALDALAETSMVNLEDTAIIATHPRYQYLARRYDLSITSLEWEAGAMPTEADWTALADLVAQTGAQVLFWEAAPPAEAMDTAADMGLENVVFPTLAHAEGGRDFLESYSEAISAIAGLQLR